MKNLFGAAASAAGLLLMLTACQESGFSEPVFADCEPAYLPPVLTPGTNCPNPCQYVYEGTIDLVAGRWEINCQVLELENEYLRVTLDPDYVTNQAGEGAPALRIQWRVDSSDLPAALESFPFCRNGAFVRGGRQSGILKFCSFPAPGGVVHEMAAIFTAPVEWVDFRVVSTRALPLGAVEGVETGCRCRTFR